MLDECSSRAATGRSRLAIAVAAAVFAFLVLAASDARASMYWGATINGETYGQASSAPENTQVWDLFERHAGRKVGILNMSQPWIQFEAAEMDATRARGATPMVTMGLSSTATIEKVAKGDYDAAIKAWAQAAKSWGHPFFFTPWWEMNGEWYSWGRDPEYVAAWRHFHDLVVAQGATNVTWTWLVNSLWFDPQSDPAPWYPGDAYVDWVGIDSYNWGRNPAQPDKWINPERTMTPTVTRVGQIAPTKPLVIVENASSEYGGNKADWIREMLGNYLPHHPQIDAYMWFNWNFQKDSGLRADWPIESSAPAQQAFRAGIQSSLFTTVPTTLPKLTKVPPPAAPAAGPASGPNDLSPPGSEASHPQVAAAPDGTAVAVWSGGDGAGRSIFARRISAAGLPLDVQRLSAAGTDALEPAVAIAADGTATVAWTRSKSELKEGTTKTNFVVESRRLGPDGALGPTLELSQVGQDASDPRVALAPDGTASIVWKRFDGFHPLIKERRVSADGELEATPSRTLSASGQDAVEPRLAVHADGSATVVWSRFDGSNGIVQARRIGADGEPEATTTDLSAAGRSAIEPDLVAAAGGAADVVWVRNNGSDWIVQHLRLGADGTAGAVHDLSATTRSAAEPRIEGAPGAVATVVWDRSNGTDFVVQARRIGAGGAPEAATRELSGTARTAAEPQLAIAPDGTGTVVWSRFDGSNWIVQSRSLKADGSPAASATNLSLAGRDAGSPQIALGAGGMPLTVWRRFDGATDVVQAAPLTAPRPEVALSPAEHDFGSLTVGEDDSRGFTISNPGNSKVTVGAIALGGPDPGQFTLGGVGACTAAPIPAGGSCDFSAGFAPSAAGGQEATIEVLSDAASSPDAAALSGTAIAAPKPPAPPAGGQGARGGQKATVDNSISLGRASLNRKRGTATLPVTVKSPGTLVLTGARVATHEFERAGTARLTVRARGKKLRRLERTGRVRLNLVVTFVPDGGSANAVSLRLRLKKSLG